MKFSCTKDNLLAGLNVVSRVASKNLTLPILGNVLVRAEQGRVLLAATNLEVGVVTQVRGKVTEDGSITIQARLLADFVGLLESEKIDIVGDGASLKVSGETSETVMRGSSADDFPIIPVVGRERPVRIPAQDLQHALSQVLFAAAQDSSRPEISGVHIAISKETIILAATDSYRLAERILRVTGGEERNLIVPTRPLSELARILPTDGEVEMYLSDSQALFVAGETELTTRLIEGQYPDYRQIIPESSSTSVTVAVDALTKLVKTASLFCKPGINDVTIDVNPSTKTLTCNAANTELGEHHGSLKAAVSGQPSTIVFNYKYLLDGLANLGSPKVTIGVSDSGSPGILRPTPDGDYFYLIMPIRQ